MICQKDGLLHVIRITNTHVMIFQVRNWMWLMLVLGNQGEISLTQATGSQNDEVAQMNLQRILKAAARPDNYNPYYPSIKKGVPGGRTYGSPNPPENHTVGDENEEPTQVTTTVIPETTEPTVVRDPKSKNDMEVNADSRQRRGIIISDGVQHPSGKQKLNPRIEQTVNEFNGVKAIPNSNSWIGHPEGLDPTLVDDWKSIKQGDWSQIVQKIKEEGLGDTLIQGGYPEWSVIGGMITFDQYITLELTSQLSPALDTVDDAVYHIISDDKMHQQKYSTGNNPERQAITGDQPLSLKSPRGHVDFGSGNKRKERVEKFPLIHHGTMDHVVDMSERRIQMCQEEAKQATAQFGVAKEREITRGTRDTWGPLLSSGFQKLIGIGRFGIGLMGLGGQVGHLTTKAEGIMRSISSLRRKTGAIIQAEALLSEGSTQADPKANAIRRGALADAVTNAACGTAKRIVKVLDALRKGKVPKELFKSVAEMNDTMEFVKERLLKPIEMELIMDDPNLITDYQAHGYIREAERETPINVGDKVAFDKGGLGYAWKDDSSNTDLKQAPGDVSGADLRKAQLGIAGNIYRENAKHKAHSEGMRPGFANKIQELIVKIQIPVTQRQMGPWLQLQLERELFEIDGVAYVLRGGYTLFQATDRDTQALVMSINDEDIPQCKELPGQNLMACPKDNVKVHGVCEETLFNNEIGTDCLKRLYQWDIKIPYLRQIGRSTRFIAFIPEGLRIEVTCPGGRYTPWAPSTKKGYVEMTIQPYCVIKLGSLRKTVITSMDKLKRVKPSEGISLETSVKRALKARKVSWSTFQAESSSQIHRHDNIENIIEGALSVTPLVIREWLHADPGGRSVLLMTCSIGGLALTCLIIIVLIECGKKVQKRHRQQKELLERDEESCCNATGLNELKDRLDRSEFRTQALSRQLKEINRFRSIISNELFRRCLTTDPRMMGRQELNEIRRIPRPYVGESQREEGIELLNRN